MAASTPQISYIADTVDLPAPLPSIPDIHASTTLLLDRSGRKVAVVGEHFVVKYGYSVDPLEGETMVFVHQNATGVRLPKVYSVFVSDGDGYIIMQRISGETLSVAWASLSVRDKELISLQLHDMFTSLRKIPDPGYYGSISGRPLKDAAFWTGEQCESSVNGPFDDEEDLNEAMIQKYVWCFDERSGFDPRFKADFYRAVLPHVLIHHPPVFTHGDLQPKNLILTRNTRTQDLQITLIDWELAGFYPSYWEYALAVYACGRWNSDWSFWLNAALEKYLTEWPWIFMLRNDACA